MRKGKLTVWLLSLLCYVHAYPQQSNDLPGLTTYFEEAYWRYPHLPKGVLEATAYAASRLTNLQPQHNDHNNCTGMPERYGLFALVENGRGYFKNNLVRVCEAGGITPEQYKKDVRLQILAVAKFLGREATARRMSMQVSAEEFAGVVERLSEIPDDSSAINLFAQQLYTYDIYDYLQKGFTTTSFSLPPSYVDLSKIFPEAVLRRLQAHEITVQYKRDCILLNHPPANNQKITNITLHTTQSSYAAAISWFNNPAATKAVQYLVRASDGQVTQLLRDVTASPTINIAHEAFAEQGAKWYSDKLIESSATLTRTICANKNIDKAACYRGASTASTNFQPTGIRIKGHQHHNGNIHTDPGKYWNWGKYADLLLDKTNESQVQAEYLTIPNGVYQVANVNSRKVMNARDGSSKVTQLMWTGNDAQRWQFEHTGEGWYIITNKMNGRVLEVPACSQQVVPVMLYELKSHDCQKWRLFQTGKNQLRLVNKASSKVLEVAAGANTNEGIIQQNNWTERNWQKWTMMPVGVNTIPVATRKE